MGQHFHIGEETHPAPIDEDLQVQGQILRPPSPLGDHKQRPGRCLMEKGRNVSRLFRPGQARYLVMAGSVAEPRQELLLSFLCFRLAR